MAKGQQRSNREPKKPKQQKAKPAAASPFSVPQSRSEPAGKKKYYKIQVWMNLIQCCMMIGWTYLVLVIHPIFLLQS
jgi:hypothetical protein